MLCVRDNFKKYNLQCTKADEKIFEFLERRRIEKCSRRSLDTNAYVGDKQDERFEQRESPPSRSTKKSFISCLFHAHHLTPPGSIATEVALLLAIKHLWGAHGR